MTDILFKCTICDTHIQWITSGTYMCINKLKFLSMTWQKFELCESLMNSVLLYKSCSFCCTNYLNTQLKGILALLFWLFWELYGLLLWQNALVVVTETEEACHLASELCCKSATHAVFSVWIPANDLKTWTISKLTKILMVPARGLVTLAGLPLKWLIWL